jgi:ubiquinone/menaquinone biosynthesis C-methylase UbiE
MGSYHKTFPIIKIDYRTLKFLDAKASLENLIESQDLGLEILHPGELEITKDLAELCHVGRNSKVLDVASGTGQSACYLAESFSCHVIGIDARDFMVEKARRKGKERNLTVEFKKSDAHDLPFDDNTFDVVISECTTCILDKKLAISEMVRVVRPGGYVGIHDVCWKEDAPLHIRQSLEDIEGEKPETIERWKDLFERAGLIDVKTIDKSYLLPKWIVNIKNKLGVKGRFKIILKILRMWGINGFLRIRKSEKIFQSKYIGYGIIVGRKLRSVPTLTD